MISRISLFSAAILAAAVALPVLAEPAPKAGDTHKAATEKPKAAAEKPKVAPAVKISGDIGKLELTDTQKTEIVKLRADNKEAVAKLQAEIKKLDEDEKAKELALLTPDQQAKYKAMQEEAAKAAEAKKQAMVDAKKATTATAPAK